MSGASSNYQADKPAGSGNAGSIKARFEQMAQQGDEVCYFSNSWPAKTLKKTAFLTVLTVGIILTVE